ncbi:MAG: HepT-like ribonuclease domain-containing protein, partial [Chloroflexota bacterium]
MPRSHDHYLKDILNSTDRIERYIKDIDFDAFEADEMRVDSVLHNLMIIGEAVKQIPDDMRDHAPSVRWRD